MTGQECMVEQMKKNKQYIRTHYANVLTQMLNEYLNPQNA